MIQVEKNQLQCNYFVHSSHIRLYDSNYDNTCVLYASMTCSADDITEIDMPVKNNNYNVNTE